MVNGLWGRKIGMTQVFAENKVESVTAINVARWVVTALKTEERDGYKAVQIGCVRDRYEDVAFDVSWIKKLKKYFGFVREIRYFEGDVTLTIGQDADFATILAAGDHIDAFGKTIGRGFQGVVKRHNFAGGPASHGGKFGRLVGSLSFMRSRGRVIKGKRMPGQYGNELQAVKNLKVVKVDNDAKIVLVKGSVPGKAGTLIFLRKA